MREGHDCFSTSSPHVNANRYILFVQQAGQSQRGARHRQSAFGFAISVFSTNKARGARAVLQHLIAGGEELAFAMSIKR